MPASIEPSPAPSVTDVARTLWRQPWRAWLGSWNWKAALLSACVRGGLFLLATWKAGPRAAFGAFVLEAGFYASVAGFYGTVLEAFCQARPVWAATLTLMAVLPALNHTLEFTLHWLRGTAHLPTALAASVAFSLLSACFNLFAMRRGILLVGQQRRSLLDDLQMLPRVIMEFLLVLPLTVWRHWLR